MALHFLPSPENRWPRLPQFGLRTMLLGVTGCSVVFAVFNALGVLWSTALVWFVLLVTVHMFANAWGTRARQRASLFSDEPQPAPRTVAMKLACTPSRLRERCGPGRCMVAVSSLGAVLGLGLGFYLLAIANWQQLTAQSWPVGSLVGVAVGSLSTALVGAFLGYLLSSFVEVGLSALREATVEVRSERI